MPRPAPSETYCEADERRNQHPVSLRNSESPT
jgi:hypothetical protein